MKKLKGVDGKLDIAWSKLVKLKAGMKCEIPNCRKTTLNSHHIYSRSKKSTRWETMNGICLCVGHHTFSSKFSAHKTPLEFTDWLRAYKGLDYMELLTIKAHQTSKLHPFEKELLLQELNKEIKKLQDG
tara:strand:+ start:6732 stop:7118 length:387 start_codon:yes stop_codon:yes gene_type:complete